MPDREKVIKGLEQCGMSSECIGRDCPYWHNVLDDAVKACDCTTELVRDALVLLKEQEYKDKMFHALEEDWKKLIEQEKQKFFVDENGKITPLPVVVRCKDCQHGEKVNSVYLCGKSRGFGIAHEPDWFCADGERRGSE